MATEPRSSEPMPGEPIASAGVTGEPAATDIRSPADIGADAALVLAAVMRMQEANRQTRERLERLRVGLGEMAAAIGRTKANVADSDNSDAAAKAVDTAAMLDELEHLADGMIEIATGESGPAAAAAQLAMEVPPPADQAPTSDIAPAAAAEAANADQVPTVSGVVSRLDPEQPAAEPAPASARDVAIAAAAAGPTVEMLKSLVEALNASIPAESSTVQRMGELSAIPAKAEAAAQEVIQAFARELTRGAAADSPHESAPEAAAVEEAVRGVQAAEQALPETAEATEPLVFDVLVEFDPVEPRPEARTEAIEPAAQPAQAVAPHAETETAESPASVTAVATIGVEASALPDPDMTAAAEVSAPAILDTDAAESSAADSQAEAIESVLDSFEIPAEPVQPVAEQAVAETAAGQATAEPVLAEETPAEAAPAETAPAGTASAGTASIGDASTETVLIEGSSAEDALAEHALDDLPAMPFEASFEDLAAAPQPVIAAALAQPAATAPAEPASADAQAAYGLPTNNAVIYEVELLARFEQMEAVPILPPELGTAVIFQPRRELATKAANLPEPPAPEAAAAEPFAELVAEPPAVADTEPAAIAQPEVTAEAHPEPAMATQPVAVVAPQPDAGAEVQPQAFAEAEPQPETRSDDGDWTASSKLPMDLLPTVDLDIAPRAEIVAPVEPEPASEPEPVAEAVHETPSQAAAELPGVDLDADFDPDDFLFGSNGKTNGAGEPALAATADSAEAPSDELAAAPPPADEAASGGSGQAAASPAAKVAADPLIPIKAMSPEERIALFS